MREFTGDVNKLIKPQAGAPAPQPVPQGSGLREFTGDLSRLVRNSQVGPNGKPYFNFESNVQSQAPVQDILPGGEPMTTAPVQQLFPFMGKPASQAPVQPILPQGDEPQVTSEEQAKQMAGAMGGSNMDDMGRVFAAVPGGLYNAGREFTRTMSGVGEWVAEKAGDTNALAIAQQQSKNIEEQLPRYYNPNNGIVADMVQTGMEWLPGIVAGDKGVTKAFQTTTKAVPAVVGAIGRLFGGTAGGAMLTANPDEQTVIVGKDRAMWPLIDGFGIDPKTGKVNDEDLFSKKMNLFVDNLIAGGVIDGTMAVGKKAIDTLIVPMLDGIKGGLSQSVRDKQVGKALLDARAGVLPGDSPEVITKKRQAVVDAFKKNQEYNIPLNDADSAMSNISGKKSSLEIFSDMTKEGDAYYDELAALNNAAQSHKGPALESALGRSQRELSGALDEQIAGREVLGDMDAAKKGIVEEVNQRLVRPAEENLGALKASRETLANELKQTVEQNPLFVNTLSNLSQQSKTNIIKRLNEDAGGLVADLQGLKSQMKEKKNNFFEDFKAIGVKGDASIPKQLIEKYKKQGLPIPKEVEAAVKRLPAKADLGKMEEIASFQVQAWIEKLSGEATYQKKAIELKNALLTDQIEKARLSTNTKDLLAVEKFDKAIKFFKGEYATWDNNPVLRKIMNTEYTRGVEKEAGGLAPLVGELGQSGTKPGQALMTDDMLNFINRNDTEGKNFGPRVFDLGVVDIGRDFQKVLNVGRLEPEDVLNITSKFENWAPVLEKSDPVRFAEIDNMINRLKEGTISEVELFEKISLAKEELQNSIDQAYGIYAKEFMERTGKSTYNVVPDSYKAFTQLFEGPQNLNRIKEMVRVTSGDPQMSEGIQLAFSKYLRDKVTTANLDNTGTKKLGVNQLDEFLNKDSTLNQTARQILGDNKVDLLEAATQRAYNDLNRTGKQQGQVMPSSSLQNKFLNAIQRVVTLAFGVLNPTAARIRVFTTQYAKENDVTGSVKDTLDRIFADSDFFLGLAENITKRGTPFLSENQKKYFYKTLKASTLYGTNENQKEINSNINLKDESEQLFGTPTEGEEDTQNVPPPF